jgi:nucleotide-binding universal stress UspA family protein
MKIEHILAATDLSDEMLARAASVGDLARTLGARITVLHVVAGHEAIPHGAPLAPPIEEPADPESVDAARAKLQERMRAYGEGVDITSEVISAGDVPRAITEYAQQHGADLIAVATHGRTGFRHMMLGSVAEGVVRRSKVPVLVVPRPEK